MSNTEPSYSNKGTEFRVSPTDSTATRSQPKRVCRGKKHDEKIVFRGEAVNMYLTGEMSDNMKSRGKSSGTDPEKKIINANAFFESWGKTLVAYASDAGVKFVVDSIMNSEENDIEWKGFTIERKKKN